MNKSTTITEVKQLKTGVYDNQPWELVLVTDAGRMKYTTFLADSAYKAKASGAEVTITYTEEPGDKINEKTGEPYMNRTITAISQAHNSGMLKDIEKLKTAMVEAGIVGVDYFD